jgi:hypothetical protein
MRVTILPSAKSLEIGSTETMAIHFYHDRQARNGISWFIRGISVALLLCSERGLGSVSDDLRFEASPFMKSTAYRRVDHLADNSAPSGAISPVNIQWDENHVGYWYIEEQRYGTDAILGGIAQQDTTSIERGLKILRWGFQQQQSDGSFNCPDAFHSTSFFIEAAAHACLLLKASQYMEQYAAETDWLEPRVRAAALWMAEPSVEVSGRKHNFPFTHRRYLVAAALGEAGVLCSSPLLIEKSKEYIREGISLQDPSGFNPEKGGYDCNYQAVGLVFAERYYDLVADDQLKQQLQSMLRKANTWLANQVRADGTIDTTGSTRVGSGQELSRNGVPKKVSYAQVYRAFYHWSLIGGDSEFAHLAEKVFAGEAIYRHQRLE